MIGRPQYTYGDSVRFAVIIDGEKNVFKGTVEIVDAYGTFEQNEEPSYDIIVNAHGAPCLFKHIRESLILGDE